MKRVWIAAVAAGLSSLSASPARAAPGEASFTPTSFVMPIHSIMLANGPTTNIPLYTCTPGAASADGGAPEDCLVDMADAAALAQLFSEPANIPPGTYESVVVMNCAAGANSFVARLEGSVELDGTTYYTTSGFPVVSSNPADLGYTSINYAGCGNTVKLSHPLTIGEGETITVNAFFALQNLSWVLGNFSTGLGGCAEAPAGAFNVCSGLPILVGYIGAVAPTLESYYITEDPSDLLATQAAGQVMLLSSDGEPFAGFLRRVYSHDSPTPSVSYDVPLRAIAKNTDVVDAGVAAAPADAGFDAAATDAGVAASYDIYAIGDPFQDVTKYRVRYPRFELRDHTGTLFTANGAGQVEYRAVKR